MFLVLLLLCIGGEEEDFFSFSNKNLSSISPVVFLTCQVVFYQSAPCMYNKIVSELYIRVKYVIIYIILFKLVKGGWYTPLDHWGVQRFPGSLLSYLVHPIINVTHNNVVSPFLNEVFQSYGPTGTHIRLIYLILL